MRYKFKILLISCAFMWGAWAVPSATATANSNQSLVPTPEVRNESVRLSEYSGLVGTAPPHETVSSAGGGFEFLPNGTNIFGFFSQTLSNDIYYEARLYGRYNYITPNPNIPGIPASNETPPQGYGITGILGYNFHPTNLVDLTPYVRINTQRDMGPVYSDTNGNHIDSTTYALLVGGKLAFKATPIFSPYVNIWGGYQTNSLAGSYTNAATMSIIPVSGALNQTAITYEVGLGVKLSEHITLVPYWQDITIFNSPDAAASASLNQGGLNQGNITGVAQVLALKLNVSW